jgi:hypothetical protein
MRGKAVLVPSVGVLEEAGKLSGKKLVPKEVNEFLFETGVRKTRDRFIVE